MSSLFRFPTEALEWVLDKHHCRYSPRLGWQPVQCINDAGHPRGDRHPSASINLAKGRYNCHACGLSGDGYDLARELHGMDVTTVNAIIGHGADVEFGSEPTWLI